jgi:ribosome-associated translation inhibitor RaiA
MRHTKSLIILILATVLALTSAGLAGKNHNEVTFFDGNIYNSDEINISIDRGSVIITNDEEDGEIEITDNYELYIDSKLIKTDKHQRQLLEEYHTLVMDIKDYAVDIGKEGAKIGIEGARVGLQAVGGVIKMIFTDYDEDDLDTDLDRATEKLEKRAELLEDRAEKIEDMAEDLDDMYYDMEKEIPAIADLHW